MLQKGTMLAVDGAWTYTPSSFTFGLQDVSSAEAGRVEDNDTMYKLRTSQKRTLSLGWNGTTPGQTSEILQAFNPEYFTLTYPDALSGKMETREFYCGDRTAPVKTWVANNKLYTSVSFDVIER